MGKPMKEVRQRSPFFAETTGRAAAAFLIVAATLLALVAVQLAASSKSKWWAPAWGLAINLAVFEWAILLRLALPVNLPPGYFRIRPFERRAGIYQRLGVRHFARLVVERIPFMGTRSGLSHFAERSRHAETVHLFALAGMAPAVLSLSLQQSRLIALWTLLFSVPIHVYPIMLQRHNRMRVERILARARKRVFHNNSSAS